MKLNFDDLRQAEGLLDMVMPLKDKIEERLRLKNAPEGNKLPTLTGNQILRICMIAGFSMTEPRNLAEVRETQLSRQNNRFYSTFFNRNNTKALFEALIKLRYKDIIEDWEEPRIASRIIAYEATRGFHYLMDESNLNSFLFASSSGRGLSRSIPALDLIIGHYDGDDEMEADLNLNSRAVPNAQIIIAGSTGSGKSNLISVIIQQFRTLSSETAYPVNFLLFDYKGEFSDPANRRWLTYFDIDASALLDPMDKPLPFNPFRDFRGKSQSELNIYSTELTSALAALDNVVLSAKMSSRLSEAIIKAYAHNQKAPITFEKLLNAYRGLLPKAETEDSITAVLSQLVRNHLFDTEDRTNLIKNCFIVKLDKYPKDGPLAKAIVYFLISKLNDIYQTLEPQATTDDVVEIRHFTIIDEAHYMLSFENKPLRELIRVGRNKGLSIILATQDMASYRANNNGGFDFYANAQYPLIMKQQTIDDSVLKGIFGVTGRELAELRSAISNLQLGELIIKDQNAAILDIGKPYKKIKVNRLI